MRPPTTSKKQVALRFSATTSSEDNDFREEQELFLHITNGVGDVTMCRTQQNSQMTSGIRFTL